MQLSSEFNEQVIMFKKFTLFLLLSLMAFPALRAETRVSVLTCAPGNEAYSLFGHTGLRYADDEKGIDIVFNYGYFDFEAPNFVWRFVLGETDYMVGAVPFDRFANEYSERGSSVTEQVLELSPLQEQALFNALVKNCRPENRVYRYNYFYNNCTTKIRDKVAEAAGEICMADTAARYATFRDALNALTASHPWYSFGINLLLGSDVDAPATGYGLQFIPQNYMLDLERCSVALPGGGKAPFVKEQNILVEGKAPSVEHSNFTPFNASLLLLLATFVVMLCEVRKKKTFWGFDVLLMALQGLAGVLLLFMALFSQHPAVGNNWLLLLLNPLSLVLIPLLVRSLRKERVPYVAWVQAAFVSLFFLSAIFSLQVYPVPVYFCAAAILVRSLFLIYKENICELSRF